MKRFASSGPLRYFGGFKLIVEVDPGIVKLARALVPKSVRLQRTRYDPHITVVQNEVVPKPGKWMLNEGIITTFEYEPYVHDDGTYYWLRVFCPRLSDIRTELGLPPSSEWSRGPDGFESFHLTIGNLKKGEQSGQAGQARIEADTKLKLIREAEKAKD